MADEDVNMISEGGWEKMVVVRTVALPAPAVVARNHDSYYCCACKQTTQVVPNNEISCLYCDTVVMYKRYDSRMASSATPRGEILYEPVTYMDATYICANCGKDCMLQLGPMPRRDPLQPDLPRPDQPTPIKCWNCNGLVLFKKRTTRVIEYQAR